MGIILYLLFILIPTIQVYQKEFVEDTRILHYASINLTDSRGYCMKKSFTQYLDCCTPCLQRIDNADGEPNIHPVELGNLNTVHRYQCRVQQLRDKGLVKTDQSPVPMRNQCPVLTRSSNESITSNYMSGNSTSKEEYVKACVLLGVLMIVITLVAAVDIKVRSKWKHGSIPTSGDKSSKNCSEEETLEPVLITNSEEIARSMITKDCEDDRKVTSGHDQVDSYEEKKTVCPILNQVDSSEDDEPVTSTGSDNNDVCTDNRQVTHGYDQVDSSEKNKTLISTGNDQDNAPKENRTATSTENDQVNVSEENRAATSTGNDLVNVSEENKTVTSPGNDQVNVSEENRKATSTGNDQVNVSEENTTATSTGNDQVNVSDQNRAATSTGNDLVNVSEENRAATSTGNDLVNVSEENKTVTSPGNDQVNVSEENRKATSTGNDLVNVSEENKTVTSPGNDQVNVSEENTTATSTGNDQVNVSDQNRAATSTGNDLVNVSEENRAATSTGNDLVNVSEENKTVTSPGNDQVNVSEENRKATSTGNDQVNLSEENKTVTSTGNDQVNVSEENRTATSTGNDQVNVSEENRAATSTGNDQVNVSEENRAATSTGNDHVNVSEENKTVTSPGNDHVNVSEENRKATSTENDQVNVSEENRTATSTGNDQMNVSEDNTTATSTGNDQVNISEENRTATSPGNDQVNVSEENKTVTSPGNDHVNVSEENRKATSTENDQVNVSEENRTATSTGNDQMNVSEDNTTATSTGNDQVNISEENRTATSPGNDQVNVSEENTTATSTGNDQVNVSEENRTATSVRNDRVTVSEENKTVTSPGNDHVTVSEENTTATSPGYDQVNVAEENTTATSTGNDLVNVSEENRTATSPGYDQVNVAEENTTATSIRNDRDNESTDMKLIITGNDHVDSSVDNKSPISTVNSQRNSFGDDKPMTPLGKDQVIKDHDKRDASENNQATVLGNKEVDSSDNDRQVSVSSEDDGQGLLKGSNASFVKESNINTEKELEHIFPDFNGNEIHETVNAPKELNRNDETQNKSCITPSDDETSDDVYCQPTTDKSLTFIKTTDSEEPEDIESCDDELNPSELLEYRIPTRFTGLYALSCESNNRHQIPKSAARDSGIESKDADTGKQAENEIDTDKCEFPRHNGSNISDSFVGVECSDKSSEDGDKMKESQLGDDKNSHAYTPAQVKTVHEDDCFFRQYNLTPHIGINYYCSSDQDLSYESEVNRKLYGLESCAPYESNVSKSCISVVNEVNYYQESLESRCREESFCPVNTVKEIHTDDGMSNTNVNLEDIKPDEYTCVNTKASPGHANKLSTTYTREIMKRLRRLFNLTGDCTSPRWRNFIRTNNRTVSPGQSDQSENMYRPQGDFIRNPENGSEENHIHRHPEDSVIERTVLQGNEEHQPENIVRPQVDFVRNPENGPVENHIQRQEEHSITGRSVTEPCGYSVNTESSVSSTESDPYTTSSSSSSSFGGMLSTLSSGSEEAVYKYEWARYRTFWCFPLLYPVSPTLLARHGFYYEGDGDEVICFCCKVRHSNWRSGEDIPAVHARISPDCPVVIGQSSGNIPIHGASSIPPTTGGVTGAANRSPSHSASPLAASDYNPRTFLMRDRSHNGTNDRSPTFNGAENNNGIHRDSRSNTPTQPSTEQQTSGATRNVADNHSQPSDGSAEVSIVVSGSDKVSTASKTALPASTQTVVRGDGVATMTNQLPTTGQQQRNSERPLNQQQPSTPLQNSETRQQQLAAQRRHAELQRQQETERQLREQNSPGALDINTERPRYPNYAVVTVRANTFSGFPPHLDQTPMQMAKAGFFYVGYGDYVRCFFCGGGLRNWEPGDDPWVEHARWFPRCTFVKNNKGQPFINIILQRQRETVISNRQRETSLPSVGVSSSGSQNVAIALDVDMQSAAVSCLREMGYTDNKIRRAVTKYRQTRGHGTFLNVLEILFSLTNDDNYEERVPVGLDIPPPAGQSQGQSANREHETSPRDEHQGGNRTPATSQEPTETMAASASGATSRQTETGSSIQNPTRSYIKGSVAQSQLPKSESPQQQVDVQRPEALLQRQQEQQKLEQNSPGALGINTERPRYPNYAVVTVRANTFSGFPPHLDQTPMQMAKAGFFYDGYGDRVRCFFCDGGLRYWDPGDDPWIEHARWFPRCTFVKNSKGQQFIDNACRNEETQSTDLITRDIGAIENSQAQQDITSTNNIETLSSESRSSTAVSLLPHQQNTNDERQPSMLQRHRELEGQHRQDITEGDSINTQVAAVNLSSTNQSVQESYDNAAPVDSAVEVVSRSAENIAASTVSADNCDNSIDTRQSIPQLTLPSTQADQLPRNGRTQPFCDPRISHPTISTIHIGNTRFEMMVCMRCGMRAPCIVIRECHYIVCRFCIQYFGS